MQDKSIITKNTTSKKKIRKNLFKNWDKTSGSNKRTSKPYVYKNLKLSKKAFDKIIGVCTALGITKEGRLFLQHVIGGTKSNLKDDVKQGWISINTKEFIEVHFGKIQEDIDKLVAAKWLLQTEGYASSIVSKKYKFPEEKLLILMEMEPFLFDNYKQTKFYDLGTLRKARSRDWESSTWHERHDAYRVPYPELIQESLDSYRVACIEYKKGEQYLLKQSKLVKKFGIDYCSNPTNKNKRRYERKRAQFLVDRCAYQAMLNRGFYVDDTNVNIGWYYMTYRTVWTGRFAEAETGLQGCSRRFTRILMSKQDNIYNYDLKSCQPTILLHEFKKAGVPCQWLEYYIEGKDENGNTVPDIKKYYAAKIGVSVAVWKVIINGTIFGSDVSNELWPTFNSIHRKRNQVLNQAQQFVIDTNGGNLNGVLKWATVLSTIQKIIKPLTDALALWKQKILEEVRYNSNGKVTYTKASGFYILGPCDTKFYITKYIQCDSKRGRNYVMITNDKNLEKEFIKKYTALILQGTEAKFIHTLETLAKDYNFTPISNAHDGLVTRGEIPEEAIEIAKFSSGVVYANLIEKKF